MSPKASRKNNKKKSSLIHTVVFLMICIFFAGVALNWEVKNRFKFYRKVKLKKQSDQELISALNDYASLKNCANPYIEIFQAENPLFLPLNRLWIISSGEWWKRKYLQEIRRRRLQYNEGSSEHEEQVKYILSEIRKGISQRGLLYELNSLLGGFFGVFLEVRSLEFFLAWGKATEHPLMGNLLKKVFIWFCRYFAGLTVPCAGSLEGRPVIMPSFRIYDMVRKARISRIQPCSCKALLLPEDAAMPRDSCMGFEYIEDIADLNRKDYREDLLINEKILRKLNECEEYGLVHQIMTVTYPSGSKGYVLCNCSGDSCVPIYLYRRYRIPMIRSSGLAAVITEIKRCHKCSRCVERCIFAATVLTREGPAVAAEECLGCGLCINTCPAGIRELYEREA